MKISIIGAGKTGSAIAFSLLHKIKMEELVLIDIDKNLVDGEELDLGHAAISLNPRCKIVGSPDYSLTQNSDIIIITAGKARTQADNLKREDLFDCNKKLIEIISKKIKKYCPEAKIIIVTNPATELGEVTKSLLKNEIIAMDNQLDTARLKYFVSKETGNPASQIKSYVTGNHGESIKLNFIENLPADKKESIKKQVLTAGRTIIELKGYTCWGIASQVLKEVENIVNLQK